MDQALSGKIAEILAVIGDIRRLNTLNEQLMKELEGVETRQDRETDALLFLVRKLEARFTSRRATA
jgi:hypothetical protein